MIAFTPGERRAILLLVGLLGLGAAHDWWSSARLRTGPPDAAEAPALRVPQSGPGAGSAAADSVRTRTPDPEVAIVDLNTAPPERLDSLPGIGPVLAGRIVEFRQRHGPFRSVEELRAVRGVGPRLLERLRSRVCVADRPESLATPGPRGG